MGLAVEVGVLAALLKDDADNVSQLRTSLAKVNVVLLKEGLPTHIEPEILPGFESRAHLRSFPYSFLHYLRRFTVYAKSIHGWMAGPFRESDDPADDPLVVDELMKFNSHLQCHSDCEGYYVPIDFLKPLYADERQIPGGILGSSHALMKELVATAPLLGVDLIDGQLMDCEVERLNKLVVEEGSFWIELAVWLCLFEAARLSIMLGSAICFL